MTAEAEAAVGADGASQSLPVHLIDPSPKNRRCDEKGLASIVDSIRENGLIHPIRVKPKGDGRYEIVCGERRWRAHLALGLKTIDVTLHQGDGKSADMLRIIENMERLAPEPLEQADGVKALLEVYDVVEAASRLGVHTDWVRRRARLTNLSPAWREELDKPDTEYPDIIGNAGSLEEIAILPPEVQDTVLAGGMLKYASTTAKVKQTLERQRHRLDAKPWTKAFDRAANGFKRCDKCVKHSNADADLFAIIDGGDQKAGYCLDAECWDAKTRGYAKYLLAEVRAADPGVLPIYDGYPRPREVEEAAAYFGEEPTPHDQWAWIREGEEEPPEGYERRAAVVVGGPRLAHKVDVWFEIPGYFDAEMEDGEEEERRRRARSAEALRLERRNAVCNLLSKELSADDCPFLLYDAERMLSLAVCFGLPAAGLQEDGDPMEDAWADIQPKAVDALATEALLHHSGADNRFGDYCDLLKLNAAELSAKIHAVLEGIGDGEKTDC